MSLSFLVPTLPLLILYCICCFSFPTTSWLLLPPNAASPSSTFGFFFLFHWFCHIFSLPLLFATIWRRISRPSNSNWLLHYCFSRLTRLSFLSFSLFGIGGSNSEIWGFCALLKSRDVIGPPYDISFPFFSLEFTKRGDRLGYLGSWVLGGFRHLLILILR